MPPGYLPASELGPKLHHDHDLETDQESLRSAASAGVPDAFVGGGCVAGELPR